LKHHINIARVLVNNPDILIGDEPTSDLNVQTMVDIMKLFSRFSQNGVTILMVTHELDTVDYGNSVYVMESGVLTQRDKF
jgi:ABC-type ATPase involved in cell division